MLYLLENVTKIYFLLYIWFSNNNLSLMGGGGIDFVFINIVFCENHVN